MDTDQASDLTIRVSGITAREGEVLLALFDHEQRWMCFEHAARKACQPCPKQGDDIQFILANLPHATYACCVLIDTNGNHTMDLNVVGLPLEDFAFSNDVIGRFGPPSFEQASFVHHGETILSIAIQ